MTLLLPQKKFLPVLDSPSATTGKKTFLTRRPITVAGKPLLAEKHLQVRPSKSLPGRKCYSSTVSSLFKYKDNEYRYFFKPDFSFSNEKLQEFENHAAATFAVPVPHETRPEIPEPVFEQLETLYSHKAVFYQSSNWMVKKSILPASKLVLIDTDKLPFVSLPASFRMQANSETTTTGLLGDKWKPSPFAAKFQNVFATLSYRRKRHKLAYCVPQLVFEQKYYGANTAFSSSGQFRPFLPAKMPAPVNLANDFAPSGIFCRSKKQPGFSVKYRIGKVTPGLDKEILSNFVLESKAVLRPICSNQIQNTAHYIIESKTSLKKELSRTTNTPEPSRPKEKILSAALKPPTNLKPAAPARLSLNVTMPGVIDNAAVSPAKASFCEKSPKHRFKLRLKLKRMAFTELDTPPKPQNIDIASEIKTTARKTLIISYRNLNIGHTWPKKFDRATDRSIFPDRCEFHQKRHFFLIGSKAHAKYTLKSMKKLITETSSSSLHDVRFPCAALNYGKRLPALFSRRNYTEAFSLHIPAVEKTLERSLEFFLTGYSATVTGVYEPETLKRIKLFLDRYYQKQKTEQLAKRSKSLRLLRFRLNAAKDGFCPANLKPERKIYCVRKSLDVFEQGRGSCLLPSPEAIVNRLKEKPLIPANRLKLQHFNFKQPESEQTIVDSGPVLKILKNDSSKALHQKHFVLPSIGDKVQKPFLCRQNLLPHPFGFPDFCFSAPVFYSLCSRSIFSLPSIKTAEASSSGLYILKKEQVFLPALSMKNPRRLLFNEENPANLVRETYLPQRQVINLKIQPADAIEKFTQDWKTAYLPLGMKHVSSTQFKQEKRKRTLATINSMPAVDNAGFKEKQTPALAIRFPAVRKLLLRAKKFTGKVFHSLPSVYAKFSEHKICPQIKDASLTLQHFSKRAIGFRYFAQKIKRFLHNFSPLYGALPAGKTCFQARFRSFRFPWKPETRICKETHAYLLPVESISPDSSMTASTVLDTSIFISVSPVVSVPFQEKFSAGISRSGQNTSATFSVTSIAAESSAHSFYHAPETLALKQPTTILSQLISHSSFYRCREKTFTRLKKAVRRYNFRHSWRREQIPSSIALVISPACYSCSSKLQAVRPKHYTITLPGVCKISGRNFAMYAIESRVIDSLQLFEWPFFPENDYSFAAAPRETFAQMNVFTNFFSEICPPSEKSADTPASIPDQFESVVQRPLHCQTQSLQTPTNTTGFAEKPERLTSFISCLANFAEIKTESAGPVRQPEDTQSCCPVFKKRSRMNDPLRIRTIHTPSYAYKPAFVPEWIETEISRPVLK